MATFVDRTIQEVKLLSRIEQEELLNALLKIVNLSEVNRIRRSPGIIGGRARIRDLRIPVSLIIHWQKAGWSDSEILENYPSMEEEDLIAVRAYYAEHREEIDQEIEEE